MDPFPVHDEEGAAAADDTAVRHWTLLVGAVTSFLLHRRLRSLEAGDSGLKRILSFCDMRNQIRLTPRLLVVCSMPW
jgi:hypothetical protein